MRNYVVLAAAVLLAGCGSAQSAEPEAEADPQSTEYWANGMNEASDRMDAAANRKTRPERSNEATAEWYGRAETDLPPVDAPGNDWGTQ